MMSDESCGDLVYITLGGVVGLVLSLAVAVGIISVYDRLIVIPFLLLCFLLGPVLGIVVGWLLAERQK